MDSASAFGRFWGAYPKRVGRKKAEQRFAEAMRKTTIEVLLEALEWQCQQPQWVKDDGEYVPMPQTWLYQERWTDEKPVKKASGPSVAMPVYCGECVNGWREVNGRAIRCGCFQTRKMA